MVKRSHSRQKHDWSSEEEARLEELWGTMRDADVAATLGKTLRVIRLKATSLKLREKKGKRAGCRHGYVAYPWTHEEDAVLMRGLGHMSMAELMEALPRRSRASISKHTYLLRHRLTQGTWTRSGLQRDTGYDWRQIKRARDALGQVWKRYGARKFMITDEQKEEICEWLKAEKRLWALHYGIPGCIVCGTDGNTAFERHSGDGLCKRCYDRRRAVRTRILRAVASSNIVRVTIEFWSDFLRVEDQTNADESAGRRIS